MSLEIKIVKNRKSSAPLKMPRKKGKKIYKLLEVKKINQVIYKTVTLLMVNGF